MCFAHCGISATKFKKPRQGLTLFDLSCLLRFLLLSLRPQSHLGEAWWVHSLGVLLENLGQYRAPSALENSRWAGRASGSKTGVVNVALALMSRRAWAGHPGISPAPDTPIFLSPPHPPAASPAVRPERPLVAAAALCCGRRRKQLRVLATRIWRRRCSRSCRRWPRFSAGLMSGRC